MHWEIEQSLADLSLERSLPLVKAEGYGWLSLLIAAIFIITPVYLSLRLGSSAILIFCGLAIFMNPKVLGILVMHYYRANLSGSKKVILAYNNFVISKIVDGNLQEVDIRSSYHRYQYEDVVVLRQGSTRMALPRSIMDDITNSSSSGER